MAGTPKPKSLLDCEINATYSQHTWTEQFKGIDYDSFKYDVFGVLVPGVVNRIYWGGGNVLQIRCDDGCLMEYVHIERPLVKVGERVELGKPAFVSGNSGTEGAHTHVNLWDGKQWDHTIDPQPYIDNYYDSLMKEFKVSVLYKDKDGKYVTLLEEQVDTLEAAEWKVNKLDHRLVQGTTIKIYKLNEEGNYRSYGEPYSGKVPIPEITETYIVKGNNLSITKD